MATVSAPAYFDERFRVAVETMIDCFGIYRAIRDDQGRIVDFLVEYVNDAACRNNHLSREAQIGRRLCEILPGHRDSELFAEYCRVCETRLPLTREMLVYTDSYGGQALQRAFDIRVTPLDDGFVAAWRDVTERKQAEARLGFLAEIGATLAEPLNIETTLQTVSRLAIPLLADTCSIHRFDDEGTLHLLATAALNSDIEAATKEYLARLEPPMQTMPPVQTVLQTQRPYVMTSMDGIHDPAEQAIVAELGLCSALVLPLIAQDRVLGLLSFGSVSPGREYRATDLPFAEEIARRIALAFENARLYDEVERSKQRAELRSELLASATGALAASLDYARTVKSVAELAVPALADLCLVHLIDDDGRLYDVGSACADPARRALLHEMLDRYPPDPGDSFSLVDVLRSGTVLHQSHLPPDFPELAGRDAGHADLIRRIGPHTFLTVPLHLDGRMLGMLQLALIEPERSYSSEDIQLLEELARRCAEAIARARLYQAAQQAQALAERAAERTQQLLAMAEVLAQPMAPAQAAQMVLDRSIAGLGGCAGELFLLNAERHCFELVATVGSSPETITPLQQVPLDAALPLTAILPDHEPVWIDALDDVATFYARFAQTITPPIGAIAVLPLLAAGQLLGALQIRFSHARSFADDDRSFARSLAHQCTQVLARARQDLALRVSEDRYRSLVRHFPNGTVYVFDQNLRYQIAGGDTLPLFGLSAEAMEGKTIWECLPDDLIAVAEPLYRATLAGAAPVELEQYYQGHIFRRIPVALRDAQGTIVAGMVISQDITAMKQAEAALQELTATLELRVVRRTSQLAALADQLTRSRDLLQTLFDGLDDGLLLLDHRGTVRAANQALATVLSMPLDAILDQSWFTICGACSPPFPATWALDAFQKNAGEQRRLRYTPAGRPPLVLDIRTLLLPASDTLPSQLIVHFVDCTERLQREAIVTQSERYIANGTLTAMIAHEINTPLQALHNFLYLVQEADAAERDHFLQLSRSELQRIGSIVEQLLDLYRPLTGKVAPVDLNALVERVLLLTRSTCEHQQVAVQFTPAPMLPTFHGRADQLIQLILNLVVNALEAMPDGGVLTVRSALELSPPAAGCAIVLTISDSGAGIPPAIARDMFEPFITSKPNGTGLGLAICRTIAAQHGGSVTAANLPAGGAAFCLRIPVAAQPDA